MLPHWLSVENVFKSISSDIGSWECVWQMQRVQFIVKFIILWFKGRLHKQNIHIYKYERNFIVIYTFVFYKVLQYIFILWSPRKDLMMLSEINQSRGMKKCNFMLWVVVSVWIRSHKYCTYELFKVRTLQAPRKNCPCSSGWVLWSDKLLYVYLKKRNNSLKLIIEMHDWNENIKVIRKQVDQTRLNVHYSNAAVTLIFSLVCLC